MNAKVLVISKPIFNNILPLVDFPKNNDVFNIDKAIESITGEANVAAYILGDYNVDVYYSGIVGNDEAGTKFKETLERANVNSKHIEKNYEEKTNMTYTIINTEKGGFSHIKVNSMKKDLTKYKYDFEPNFIVFDDKDFSGANAALNNYPNIPTIFYGKNPNKDVINMCKNADYVVCNIDFASKLTGMEIVLNKPKTVVDMYQKLVDLFKGIWIITLGEYGVVYSNENQVKMIPALKTDVVDGDKASGVFFGTFAYAIVNGIDIENAVRLANINASQSLKQIGAINGLMDVNELLKNKIINQQVMDTSVSMQKEQIITQNQTVETLNINGENNNV